MGKPQSPLPNALSLPGDVGLRARVGLTDTELGGIPKRGQTRLQSPRSCLGSVPSGVALERSRFLPVPWFPLYNMRGLYKLDSKFLSVLIFQDLDNLLFGSSDKKKLVVLISMQVMKQSGRLCHLGALRTIGDNIQAFLCSTNTYAHLLCARHCAKGQGYRCE